MESRRDNPGSTDAAGGIGSHSLSLFRLFGIEIRLDISVLVIFSLIVFSLGSGGAAGLAYRVEAWPGVGYRYRVRSRVLCLASGA